MRFRKLRIAWSVVWGVVAVLLCVLWVRSYWRVDYIEKETSVIGWNAGSVRGEIAFSSWHTSSLDIPNWKYENYQPDYNEPLPKGGFLFRVGNGALFVFAPHCSLVLVACIFAALPWVRFWRFSLRTLLIATTLVAVGLGLIVWLR
jgi:hypothetical protein